MEGFHPLGGRKRGLKQKAAHNIFKGMKDVLSLTILRRGVGTGHAEVYAAGEEERARAGVVELLAVVALNRLHGGAELSSHVGKKVS